MASSKEMFDLRLIEWDAHPLLRAVQKNNLAVFKKFLASERKISFGVDSYNYARTGSGETPLMVTFALNLTSDVRRNALFTMMKLFHLDPNIPDAKGRTSVVHAILNNCSIEVVEFLIKNGADLEIQDDFQLTPLMYAVGSGRSDLVKLICPDYSAKLREALKNKFGNWDNLSGKLRSPRKDLLEIPFLSEGSPKRSFHPVDSPLGGTPLNGIRFRLSPSSPSNSSSSPLSSLSNGNHPATRRTSLDRPNTGFKSVDRKVMRRVCSAVFDSRLWDKAWGAMQFAQLTQNLGIYLEEADYYLDKSPEPRDEKEDEVSGIEEGAEKEPRRVSIHGVPVSSPILIKSRSVEDSINKQHGTPPSFRMMPRGERSWRKNALASGHLIERQGSAPQLQLKRRPRPSSETSTGIGSPVGCLSRNATRPQITISPLVNSKLTNQEQK